MIKLNLLDRKFGRLKVIEKATNKGKKTAWKCVCDCGSQIEVATGQLTRKITQSCGCIKKELLQKRNFKHGFSKRGHSLEKRFYHVYQSMVARCCNKNSSHYCDYGGRGITVCDAWVGENGFINFKNDMYGNYRYKLSIDRIDNNGNYCKENCRWVNQKVQANNTRVNRIITHNRESHTLAQWADIINEPQSLIDNRLNALGWSVEDTLETKRLRQQRNVIYNGLTMTLSSFCKKFKLKQDKTYHRLFSLNWSVEDVINNP